MFWYMLASQQYFYQQCLTTALPLPTSRFPGTLGALKISKKYGSRMVDFSFYAANNSFVAETDESHDDIIGRVLENTFEGNWRASHNEFNESVYVTDTGFTFHPFSWTLERLKEDDLLLDKFNVIAGMAKAFGVTRRKRQ
jgi:hypothetical protein